MCLFVSRFSERHNHLTDKECKAVTYVLDISAIQRLDDLIQKLHIKGPVEIE